MCFSFIVLSTLRALATAEGTYLAQYNYKQFKTQKKESTPATYELLASGDVAEAAWARGKLLAEAQNMARDLYELPRSLDIYCLQNI